MNAGAMRRALARKSIDRARAVLGRAVGYETDTARAMWLYLIAGYLGIAPLVVLALVAHHI